MNGSFFAMLSRMKLIGRWGLMRNTRAENIAEHSFDTAVIAHALTLLKNRRFGGSLCESRAVLLALYHDAAEILTGDLPTPVKYASPGIRDEYKRIERDAADRLLSYLPPDLAPDYRDVISPGGGQEDAALLRIVKAADKLSALIKCIEEEKAGNTEFRRAAVAQEQALRAMGMPEVDCFMEEFLPCYGLTLDEQESDICTEE